MNYLLDSDVVIDLLSGRETALLELERLAGDDLAISMVTYMEV